MSSGPSGGITEFFLSGKSNIDKIDVNWNVSRWTLCNVLIGASPTCSVSSGGER